MQVLMWRQTPGRWTLQICSDGGQEAPMSAKGCMEQCAMYPLHCMA